MPNHINSVLANMAVHYQQEASGFVADKIFPSTNVRHQSDVYHVYNPAAFYSDDFQQRAPCTESVGIDCDTTQDNYTAKVWSAHKDLSKQDLANADEALDLPKQAVNALMQQALIRKDTLFAENFLKTGVWSSDLVGGVDFTQFNDAAGNAVLAIESAMTAQQKKTGLRPNTMVLSRDAYTALTNNPFVIDRVRNGTASGIALVEGAQLAQLFNMAGVYIMDSVVNNGTTTDFIASDTMLLAYVAPNAGKMVRSAGLTFNWNKYNGSHSSGIRVERFDIRRLECERVELTMAFVQKVTAPDLGTLLTNVVL